MNWGIRDLRVGARYMTCGGFFIREITAMEGEDVCYVDQHGPSRCKKTTFVKKCYRLATDEDVAVQSTSLLSDMKINHEATNKLLESYVRLQNQLDAWTKSLVGVSEYLGADLTSSQKESVRLAVKHSKRLTKLLQKHQGGLTK